MNPTTQSSTTSTHPARQQRILRLPEVKAKTGFGRSTIYALMANGEFPRSIRIGARAVGWLESDIDQWIETRRIGAAYGRLGGELDERNGHQTNQSNRLFMMACARLTV